MREFSLGLRGVKEARQGPEPRRFHCAALPSLQRRPKVERKQLVAAPPKDFDYRSETLAFTRELVDKRYKELSDLVHQGQKGFFHGVWLNHSRES